MSITGPPSGQSRDQVGYTRTPELRPGTVLLVEDNADDIELTMRALRRTGITNPIVTARDGVQALDYLRGKGEYAGRPVERPEIVLLDLKLPRIDGLEVLAQLKTDLNLKVLPVVVLTSSTDERDVQRAYELGANSYLCKPGDFADLLYVMKELGKYWLGIVIPPPNKRATS